MSLSSVLKKRRKELGLTLAQIADRVGVSEATVQRWESGNIQNIRYGKIDALAEVLGISPIALMGWPEGEESATKNGNGQIDEDEDLIRQFQELEETLSAPQKRLLARILETSLRRMQAKTASVRSEAD